MTSKKPPRGKGPTRAAKARALRVPPAPRRNVTMDGDMGDMPAVPMKRGGRTKGC